MSTWTCTCASATGAATTSEINATSKASMGILLSPYCRPPAFSRLAPGLRAEARQEVDEAHDLVVLERLGGHRHGPVEIRGGLRLEAAQQPQEVGEVLTGQPRGLL